MMNNESKEPTTACVSLIPMASVHAQMQERVAYAKDCMPEFWRAFIQKCAVASFGEKEVIEGRKLRNLYGSVESFQKLFEQTVNEFFDVNLELPKE
jgi:hypothetical protein